MNSVELSIVIPAYNEARRIGNTLAAIAAFLRQRRIAAELIVVDDGSRDGTADVVRRHASALELKLLTLPHNCGKGQAVRAGVLASRGRAVLICDADHATPVDEYPRLHARLVAGADIAIGSRDLPGARLEPPQPWPRRLAAWAFRGLRRRLLLPDIRDTQCGFKLFRGDVARRLFAQLTTSGWLFDVEVLGLARRDGLRIAEVPVRWRDDRDSRVRPWAELLPTLCELLRLRRRLRR